LSGSRRAAPAAQTLDDLEQPIGATHARDSAT
jgi:hypothetical protein